MDKKTYTTYQQHEPLRAPLGWSTQEKRFVAQLEELFDDIYKRYNRLKLKDMSQDFQDLIVKGTIQVSRLQGIFGDSTNPNNWYIDFDDGDIHIGSISADKINTGTLNAGVVKILGDTQFYWDAQNINIVNPNNQNQIIRIGKYDNTHYGIGFSGNGGRTWTNSMDFDGVTATSIGAIEISAEKITSGILSVDRLGANSIAIGKLTGKITQTDVTGGNNWEINLTDGTFTIGSINADHITAGTIDATKVTVKDLDASKITAGTLSADRIAANSIAVGKLTGTITKTDVTGGTDWKIDLTNGSFTIGNINADHITTGTIDATKVTVKNLDASKISTGILSADRIDAHTIAVSKLSGKIENGDWKINLDNGTFSIGKIDAGNITTGTLSADRIAADSIAVAKLTGDITNGNWKIDLKNGTFTIGNISATNITTGTLDCTNLTVTNLSADSITAGTLSAGRIEDHSLGVAKLTGSVSNNGWGINFGNSQTLASFSVGNLSVQNLTAAGITTVNQNGITIKHTGIDATNSKTVLDASGLRIYNASNTVIGGIMTLDNKVCSVMDTMYNASYSLFKADIGQFSGYSPTNYGINFHYNGIEKGSIGIGLGPESNPDFFNIAARNGIDINISTQNDGNINILTGTTGSLELNGHEVNISSDGDFTLIGVYNGMPVAITFAELYAAVHGV